MERIPEINNMNDDLGAARVDNFTGNQYSYLGFDYLGGIQNISIINISQGGIPLLDLINKQQ